MARKNYTVEQIIVKLREVICPRYMVQEQC